MLRDEPLMMVTDPMLDCIAAVNGNPGGQKKLAEGVYQAGHFGSSNWPAGYEHYPENLSIGPYGVCDDYQQVIDACPELRDPDRRFVIRVTEVRKDRQESSGGWRWHKWGEYIGKQTPTTEYLYNEPVIDRVFVYHIYERLP